MIRDKLQQQNSVSNPVSSTSSPNVQDESKLVEEFVKEVADMKIIEMPVGADNYLADSIQREFADAVVDKFSTVASVLSEWHGDGARKSQLEKAKGREEVADSNVNGMRYGASSDSPQAPTIETEESPLSVIFPDEKLGDADASEVSPGSQKTASRVFRLMRGSCQMDVPAPLIGRDTKTMKEVMELAQRDKSSGVFSFPMEDIQGLRDGTSVLMVDVVDTGVKFSREIFVGMTVSEVLGLSDRNPVSLSFSIKKAESGFDVF